MSQILADGRSVVNLDFAFCLLIACQFKLYYEKHTELSQCVNKEKRSATDFSQFKNGHHAVTMKNHLLDFICAIRSMFLYLVLL